MTMVAKAPTSGWVLICLTVFTTVKMSAGQVIPTSTELALTGHGNDQELPMPCTGCKRQINTEMVPESVFTELPNSTTTEAAVTNLSRDFNRGRSIRETAKERIEAVATEVIQDMTDKLLNKVIVRLRQTKERSTSESVGWTIAVIAVLSTIGVVWALCRRPRRNHLEDLEANFSNLEDVLLPYDSQQEDTTYRPNGEEDEDFDFTEVSESTQYPNSSATPSRHRLTLSRFSSPEFLRRDASAMTPQTTEFLEVRPPTKNSETMPEPEQIELQDQEERDDNTGIAEVQDEESDDNFTQNFANATAELTLDNTGPTSPATTVFTRFSSLASPATTFHTARSSTNTPTSSRPQITQNDGNETTRILGSTSTPTSSPTLLSPDFFGSYQQRRPQLERQNAMPGRSTESSGSSGIFSLIQPVNLTIQLKKLLFRDYRDTPDPRTGQVLIRGRRPKLELKLASPISERSTIPSLGSSPILKNPRSPVILKQPKRTIPSLESTPIVKRDPQPRRVRFNPEIDCPHLTPCGDSTYCIRKSTENSRKKGRKFVEAREKRQSGEGPPKSDFY